MSKAVPIDTTRIFPDRSALETYLENILVQLKNQRVLEEASVSPSFGTETEDGLIPVSVLVSTKDTWNIIALPYPKYDSNSGFVFKLKIKDYNFFGTMRTLSGDISYEYAEDENHPHRIGTAVSFDIPFKLGLFDSNWTNNIDTSYKIGAKAPKVSFKSGVDFSLPLHKTVSLNFGVSKGVIYNPEYEADNDAFYLTEAASLSLPVILAQTEKNGNIVWSPSASVAWNIDPLESTLKNDGINRNDLKGPDVKLSHGLSFGRIDWKGNFRQGYSAGISQSLSYDTFFKTYTSSYSLSADYYHAFKQAGFASRIYVVRNFGSKSREGGRIRGVRDSYINTDSALLLNMDVPIKVWQTDWRALGGAEWTKWLDFEMQVAPFIDMAVGNNDAAGSYYQFKDGWYATGIEIIGYPNKLRSIQGRISAGLDVIRLAEKAGNRIAFVDKVVNKLFNTGWRTGSWYELSIGIGLHY